MMLRTTIAKNPGLCLISLKADCFSTCIYFYMYCHFILHLISTFVTILLLVDANQYFSLYQRPDNSRECQCYAPCFVEIKFAHIPHSKESLLLCAVMMATAINLCILHALTGTDESLLIYAKSSKLTSYVNRLIDSHLQK